MRDLIKDPWIQVHSGRVIDLLRPRPEDILLTDIAHALSNLCRFGGHSDFYSVAQHSILVSMIVPRPYAMWGLMHDASEAYLGDIPKPLKLYLNGGYADLEKIYMKAICERFCLPYEEPAEVKRADNILLVTERRDLLLEHDMDWGVDQKPAAFIIKPMDPKNAKWRFIEEFLKISGEGLA
jgi:5'-deoxynucleotidase YfbR-like HD superfamily hydrolase